MSLELYNAVASRIKRRDARLTVARRLLSGDDLTVATATIIEEVLAMEVTWPLPEDLLTSNIRISFVRSLIKRGQISMAQALLRGAPPEIELTIAQEVFDGWIAHGYRPQEELFTRLGRQSLSMEELEVCATAGMTRARFTPDEEVIALLPDESRRRVFTKVLQGLRRDPKQSSPTSVLLALTGLPDEKIDVDDVVAMLEEHIGEEDAIPVQFAPFLQQSEAQYQEALSSAFAARLVSDDPARRPPASAALAWLGRAFTDTERQKYVAIALAHALYAKGNHVNNSRRATQDDILDAFADRPEMERMECVVDIVNRALSDSPTASLRNISITLIPKEHQMRVLATWAGLCANNEVRLDELAELCISAA